METELSLRKQLDGLAESSRYESTESWAPSVAPIETSLPAANAKASLRVAVPYADENDAPQFSQHTDVSSQRSGGSDSAEFWAPPVAPIETSPPAANAKASLRVRALYTDENDAPQFSQHTDVSSQRSVGSGRKLITGIAVVLSLGLSALAYFFWVSPSEKTTTQTAELAPSVPYPPATPAKAIPSVASVAANPSMAPAAAAPSAAPVAATPVVAPAARTAGAAPAPATASAAPAAAAPPPWANSESPPEPVQAPPKVAQSGPVLYLQRPGVNIRSAPSPTGSAVGTAPKGTRFKVTNRQGDWIQVEKGRLKGWINAEFLAPSEPR
jgi:hypothetical protein